MRAFLIIQIVRCIAIDKLSVHERIRPRAKLRICEDGRLIEGLSGRRRSRMIGVGGCRHLVQQFAVRADLDPCRLLTREIFQFSVRPDSNRLSAPAVPGQHGRLLVG